MIMINLEKFNYCHDGKIEAIVFDIDIDNWDKEQNLIITYSIAIEEKINTMNT